MPAQTEYSAPAWGQSAYVDLVVPSGGTILAKRLDFQDIIAAGLMDEFDQLAPVAEEKVVGPAQGRRKPTDRPAKKLTKAQQAAKEAAELKATLGNKKEMQSMMRLMALILPIIVRKPEIQATYTRDDDGNWSTIEPEDREDGVIYADTVPMADQMFLLNWAMEGMDMDDLKSVREQTESAVGSVDAVPEPTDAPEPSVRS